MILITRPYDQAISFAERLEAAGYEVLIEPMLTIKATDFTPPDLHDYQALVFTSVNAVRTFARHSSQRHLPVYCVGEKTAQEAKREGYDRVYTGEGTGRALADMLEAQKQLQNRPFLHVRGEDSAFAMEAWLAQRGVAMHTLVAYQAQKARDLGDVCAEALRSGKIKVIPFFSRRTAESFLALTRQNALWSTFVGIKALSISARVVESLREAPWSEVLIAKNSDENGIFELIRHVYPRSGK